MPDASTCWEEGHTVLLGKLLNQSVLSQIGLALVLDIVIKREDQLLGIVDLGRLEALPLGHGRERVVVCHEAIGLEGELVAGTDELPLRQADGVSLYNLLGQGLGRCRAALLGEEIGRGILHLCVEGLSPGGGGRG